MRLKTEYIFPSDIGWFLFKKKNKKKNQTLSLLNILKYIFLKPGECLNIKNKTHRYTGRPQRDFGFSSRPRQ